MRDGELEDWVAYALGAPPVKELFRVAQTSLVVGLRLADGREVVVKARPGVDRAKRCVAAQAALHADGFSCPAPLTDVVRLDGLAVHAEDHVPGGDRLLGTGTDTADRFALLLADLAARLERLDPRPPEPGPMWLSWDHPGSAVWPHELADRAASASVSPPAWLTDVAVRVRRRILRARLPHVVGHGDWETQNIRWRDGSVHVVHDWDSLTARPEAALVGAAAATFASDEQPTLAPLESSERFVTTYERERSRVFTGEEREVAWATGLWLAAHNALVELVERKEPSNLERLSREGPSRLARAGA